ncbi:hypothetical protein [Defluviimonas sp. WL0075]|uniref:ABM domain-containing protein n=1 Tax=Albidovulum sediminicola TaxID=2984331 RepID=A0ABT2Z737_9RHOB|nr:hypothetical protein [Defluviimonas sp. WL0075]MCV2866860.1 hypothetical protein [Defluviimonas sp. WL0075]
MHIVINTLSIKPDADWATLARLFDGFCDGARPDHPGLVGAQIVQSGPEEAILIISFSDAETMASFSSTVAAPWFAEHVRPFLAGPANRKTGAVVAGFPR